MQNKESSPGENTEYHKKIIKHLTLNEFLTEQKPRPVKEHHFMPKKSLTLNDKQDQDFLEWPIQKIVEQYHRNPFFKRKIVVLANRRESIGRRLYQNRGNNPSNKFQGNLTEKMISMRNELNVQLKSQYGKLSQILDAVSKS